MMGKGGKGACRVMCAMCTGYMTDVVRDILDILLHVVLCDY